MKNNPYLIEMGGKITSARKAKRMSLQKLSDLSGIDLFNLWFIEQGQRNCHIPSLKSIADVLKKDIRDFI